MPYQVATTTQSAAEGLKWTTDGCVVLGDPEWQDITFLSQFVYKGGEIGILPRIYHPEMYMTLKISNIENPEDKSLKGYAQLTVQILEKEIFIGSLEVPALVVDQTYDIKVDIYRTNYRIYLNGTVIFDTEYAGMAKGQTGLYATANNLCTSAEVQSLFPDGWTSNVASVSGAIADIQEFANEDKYIYVMSPNGTEVYIEQTLPVTASTAHTLSIDCQGVGKVKIIEVNGTAKTYTQDINQPEWGRVYFTQTTGAGTTSVKVRICATNSSIKANKVQLEAKGFSTPYIENSSTTSKATRQRSVITYPSKGNINGPMGSISMFVKPAATYTGTAFKPMLFEYGQTMSALRVYYDGASSKFTFKYGTQATTLAGNFDKDQWYHVVAMWSNGRISIAVNNVIQHTNGEFTFTDRSEVVRIGHTYDNATYQTFYGVIDETIVYAEYLRDEDIRAIYESPEPILDKTSMLMRATFNFAIGNFNKSWVEMTLAPKYGSPVIVEKASGKPMQKVSFFDWESGEYRTWNEEEVIYDKMFDYVVVSYSNLDTESFKIVIRDQDGNTVGDPYKVEGNRVFLTLNDEQKIGLHNHRLYVMYQVEDSYTVDFNIGVPDSFRVNIGKHSGEPVHVTYEGNDFQDYKLATMIEMNPLLNPNHEGFLYITRNIEKVTAFRVRVTPEDLPADGVSEALLVVEPLDANGNFISHAKLIIEAGHGKIVPNFDRGSVLAKERAGRYMYRYRANLIHQSEVGRLEIEDVINIIDEQTGLGVQVPITLTTVQIITHVIDEDDTAESIALAHGSTIEDVMTANGITKRADLDTYIKTHIGGGIKIPLNYLGSILRKTHHGADEEVYEDYAIFIYNLFMKYMGQTENEIGGGLLELLDVDNDGKIDMGEIDWLNQNMYTKVLIDKYEEIQEYFISN